MKPIIKRVTRQEFEDFIRNYPRPLKKDCYGVFDPPLITYNDFALANKWPYSVIASTYIYDDDPSGYYYEPENKREYSIVVNYAELFEKKEREENENQTTIQQTQKEISQVAPRELSRYGDVEKLQGYVKRRTRGF